MENELQISKENLLEKLNDMESSFFDINSELRSKYLEIVELRDHIALLEAKNSKMFAAIELLSNLDNYTYNRLLKDMNIYPNEYATSIIRELELMI